MGESERGEESDGVGEQETEEECEQRGQKEKGITG